MRKNEFHNETMYLLMMHIFRNLLSNGQMTQAEYHKAERLMAKKYQPKISRLLADLSLT